MSVTRIEIGPDAALRCTDCDRWDLREAMLIDEYGYVLLRGTACPHCHRHRAQEPLDGPIDPFEADFDSEFEREFERRFGRDDTGSNRFAFRR